MRDVCPAGRVIQWKREVVTEAPLFTRTRVLHVDDATPCACEREGRRSGSSPLSVTKTGSGNKSGNSILAEPHETA